MSALLDFATARAHLLAAAVPVQGQETLPTLDALGRVLAQPLHAPVAVPPHDNSGMDGYALRCADLAGAGGVLPLGARIPAGAVAAPLAAGTAARIFTGAPIPQGADAVVMQERCTALGDAVRIDCLPLPGENIRRAGEDIALGDCVLNAGSALGPAQLGLAASIGMARLDVRRRLRVALFSTGDELLMPGDAPRPGAIYNANRYTLHSLLRALGCAVTDYGIVADNLAATRAVLREAAPTHDLILTSGGVSVGEEDHVRAAVAAEGEIALWKLAIKPGKPLAFGHVRRPAPAAAVGATADAGAAGNAAFIGLPGNPVAAFVTFVMLVRPFIHRAMGLPDRAPASETRTADFDWPPGGKREARREFLRARRDAAGGVSLYPHQGSGVLTSCAWADGLVDNPPDTLIRRGDPVSFLPLAELLR